MKVGVFGAGQLGRMLALSGYPLGLEFVFYDSNPDACAGTVAKLIVGEFDDKEKLQQFAREVDIVTVEFENIPLEALNFVAGFVPVYPNPEAIKMAQDRVVEKQFFRRLGIPTPEFYAADDLAALAEVAESFSDALILKSRRFGYDGKGQLLLDASLSADEAWDSLGSKPLIAEQHMQFKREVSIIAARSSRGEVRFYSLIENRHQRGILKSSRVSSHDAMQARAEVYVTRVLDELNYVGVMAFEFFDCDGELVAVEFAPRVHNSGHWTIEGANTSQFENHLRAILNWPLGDSGVRDQCVMYNIIGEMPDITMLLNIPGTHVHIYGKTPRPGRKIGHVTLCDANEQSQLAIEGILNKS